MCFKRLIAFFRRSNKPGEKPEDSGSAPGPDDENIPKPEPPTEQDMHEIKSSDKPVTGKMENSKHKIPELNYLEKLIRYRLNQYVSKHNNEDANPPKFPHLSTWRLPFYQFVIDNKLMLSQQELTLMLIALVPHIEPDFFNRVIKEKFSDGGHSDVDTGFMGGTNGKNCRFFLPTGETVLFLIAGSSYEKRLEVQEFFRADHVFREKKILWLEDMQNGEPAMHGRVIMSQDYVDILTYGEFSSPQFSISFPAKKIAPEKKPKQEPDNLEIPPPVPSFDQLVIPATLKEQIGQLKSWLKYNDQLRKKMPMLRQGYRTLFYGPPGTGKTFTAKILGNELKRDVYKIDLSMVVSKYIGETEKNLELLFAKAEDKQWILFFDEADALFGKRSNVREANDKYANQEVSYLLQRIEDYNGLVILATNLKTNIDDAFMRRFNSVLKFPFPDAAARAEIWEIFLPKGEKNTRHFHYHTKPGEDVFPDKYDIICGNVVHEEIDIPDLVKKYELSGGSIMNVIHYAGIKALERQAALLKDHRKARMRTGALVEEDDIITIEEDDPCNPEPPFVIYLSDILDGIRDELLKEGKPFSL